MLELIINFVIGLTLIGIPSYIFYKLGMDAGIERGEKRQIMKDLMLHGIIEKAERTDGETSTLLGRLFSRKWLAK